MSKIAIDWFPDRCTYCKNKIACRITKTRLFVKTSVIVCEDCARKIWEEETNRVLP